MGERNALLPHAQPEPHGGRYKDTVAVMFYDVAPKHKPVTSWGLSLELCDPQALFKEEAVFMRS